MSFQNDEEDIPELVDEVELVHSESNMASVTGSVVAVVHPMRTADNHLCMVLVLVFILHLDVELLSGNHRARALGERKARQSGGNAEDDHDLPQ